MRCLLDTDIWIGLLRGRPAFVRTRLNEMLVSGASPCLSVVTMHELWLGVLGSARREAGVEELAALAARFEMLPFDGDDARIAAEIRHALRARGTPIGPFDLLIAAQALRRSLVLVTGNLRELRRVDGLRIESWLE